MSQHRIPVEDKSGALRRWRWATPDTGGLRAVWQRRMQEDPQGHRLVMTIELVLGGDRVIRVARKAVSTTSGTTGEEYIWLPLLVEEPVIDQQIDLDNQGAKARSISITIPSQLVPTDTMLKNGRLLQGVAEVSLNVNGGDHDLRRILMRGDMTGGLSFGRGAETVDITITDRRLSQGGLVPPYVLDITRYGNILPASIGMRLPIVINRYREVPAIRVDQSSSDPIFAVCISDTQLTVDDATAGNVFVNGESVESGGAGEWEPFSTGNIRDDKGLRTLLVDFTGATITGGAQDGDALNVTVSKASGERGINLVRVIERLLNLYTDQGAAGLDLASFSRVEARLPRIVPPVLLNASGDQSVSILKFIESGLLKSYPPVRMVFEGRGLGLAILDRRQDPLDNVALVGGEGGMIDRISNYSEIDRDKLYTSFELHYNFSPMDKSYESVIRRDAETSTSCKVAQQQLQANQPMEPIEAAFIDDDATAAYVINWLVAHLSVPSYYVEWRVSPALWFRTYPGQLVNYTDPDSTAFSDVEAVVMRRSYSRSGCILGLRIWHPYWATPR